jgi:hypothetical protein
MTFCPAAITSAALFTAIVLLDLAAGKYRYVPFHALGGFFCTIGLSFICQYLGDTAAWILLSIPFIFILLGLFLIWLSTPLVVSALVKKTDSCDDECSPTPSPLPTKITCSSVYSPTLPASVTSVPPSTSVSTIGCKRT